MDITRSRVIAAKDVRHVPGPPGAHLTARLWLANPGLILS
jgi:hypothetical protein